MVCLYLYVCVCGCVGVQDVVWIEFDLYLHSTYIAFDEIKMRMLRFLEQIGNKNKIQKNANGIHNKMLKIEYLIPVTYHRRTFFVASFKSSWKIDARKENRFSPSP